MVLRAATKEKLEAFLQRHWTTHEEGGYLDFQTIIPMPAELEGTQSPSDMIELPYLISQMDEEAIIEELRKPSSFMDRRTLTRFNATITIAHFIREDGDQWEDVRAHAEALKDIELAAKLKEYAASDMEKLEQGRVYCENREKFGYSNWYDWRNANWNTKWGAYSCSHSEITKYDGDLATEGWSLEIKFDTAWSPPEPIFGWLASEWEEIDFTVEAIDEGFNFSYEGRSDAGSVHFDGDASDFDPEYDEEDQAMYDRVYGEGSWAQYVADMAEYA
jgi:hypothetical protein